jgi:glutamate racemase
MPWMIFGRKPKYRSSVSSNGAYAAAAATRNGKIGIIGTYATIHSGAYESFLSQINPDFEIYKQACPLFVPFVEEGLFEDDLTDQIIARYLTDIKGENIDTLLLGCTHYPLIKTALRDLWERM